jgi:hypothetical protein
VIESVFTGATASAKIRFLSLILWEKMVEKGYRKRGLWF